MKIKDIVRLAAVFLQLDVNEEVFCKDADRAFVEAELSADKRLKLLKDCAEFVLNQLATDYLPLKKTEKVFSEDGTIPYGEFSRDMLEAVRVKDGYGCDVRFSHLPDGLFVKERGEMEVTYFYRPGEKTFFDEAETGSCRVSARVIALGTAAEYSFVCGLFEEAQLWDGRFKDSLKIALRKKGAVSLKARRWF